MDAELRSGAELSGEERLTLDPLTGLHNEHLFRLTLPGEFARARDRESNAALLVLRLDNILAINASRGRSGGDEALRAVSYVLGNYRAAEGRASHLAFRLAGPVFGYYIPACSAPEAAATAEGIRQRVLQSKVYLERLTVSIGIVNFYEFFLAEGTREQIALRLEQTAMYRLGIAQRQGSNTICDSSDTESAAAGARPTVLIVEPEPASVELLVQALQGADRVVRVCEDGETALSMIQESPPGVIICEAMTPRLNGFTIRERLQANALWNAIPFILVSHRKNEEMIRKAVDADIRHYFRKPVSITEVVGLVLNLTRSAAG
jgi:diguanylate cyclase (GGDEF)-like protein